MIDKNQCLCEVDCAIEPETKVEIILEIAVAYYKNYSVTNISPDQWFPCAESPLEVAKN